MTPLRRSPVNKSKSSAQYRHNVSRTKAANVGPGLARGGIRL